MNVAFIFTTFCPFCDFKKTVRLERKSFRITRKMSIDGGWASFSRIQEHIRKKHNSIAFTKLVEMRIEAIPFETIYLN